MDPPEQELAIEKKKRCACTFGSLPVLTAGIVRTRRKFRMRSEAARDRRYEKFKLGGGFARQAARAVKETGMERGPVLFSLLRGA